MLGKILDRFDAFTFSFDVLTASGFWFIRSNENWKHVLYAMFKGTCFVAVVFVLIIEIGYIYLMRSNVHKLAESASFTTLLVILLTKNFIFYSDKNAWQELSKQFKHNLDLPYVGVTDGDMKIRNKAGVFYYLAFSAALTWFFLPLLDQNRTFPFPFIYFSGITETPIYELVYIILVLVDFICTMNLVTIDLIIIGCMVQFGIQFDILVKNFEEMSFGAKVKEKIKRNVRHHFRVSLDHLILLL